MIKKITILGSGNVATNLAFYLNNKGYKILEVYSRNIKNAKILSELIKCDFTNKLSDINLKSDIYIVSIKDNAIEKIASKLNLKDKLIVHTSGSISIDVLKNISNNYGSFYPLQTFTKECQADFSNIPICIEGNIKKNEKILEKFANTISKKVFILNSIQREKLHLSAVFASNFSNFMQVIAQDICEKEGIDKELLKPLLEEVYKKNMLFPAEKNQTGPAIRKDSKTIEKHLKLLGNEELKDIYTTLSKMISKRFS